MPTPINELEHELRSRKPKKPPPSATPDHNGECWHGWPPDGCPICTRQAFERFARATAALLKQ